MDGLADEQQLSKAVKKGAISEIIQKEAKKISSPALNDFLIASRRGFKDQVLEALKEGGSAKACSTDKVRNVATPVTDRRNCCACIYSAMIIASCLCFK